MHGNFFREGDRLEELGNVRGEGDTLHKVRKIGRGVEGRGFYSQS